MHYSFQQISLKTPQRTNKAHISITRKCSLINIAPVAGIRTFQLTNQYYERYKCVPYSILFTANSIFVTTWNDYICDHERMSCYFFPPYKMVTWTEPRNKRIKCWILRWYLRMLSTTWDWQQTRHRLLGFTEWLALEESPAQHNSSSYVLIIHPRVCQNRYLCSQLDCYYHFHEIYGFIILPWCFLYWRQNPTSPARCCSPRYSWR